MRFTLHQIKKSAHLRPFTFDQKVDVSELESMNNDIREIEPVRIQGECTMEGDEFIFMLTISGVMILPCARTLVDVPYSFEVNATEVFSASPYFGEDEIEDEIHPIEGEVIDLTPCILENIILAIPYRVFSEDKHAQEHALLKGEGWELTLEEELEDKTEEKTIDPRLKKLKTLLDNEDKDKK